MLIRFAIQNYRSMRDRQELSLVASSLNDSKSGLIPCDAVPAGYLLPSAVIYGANASGKSNLIAGLDWARMAVLESHRGGEPGGGIPRTPFALDPESRTQPTVCEVDFVRAGIRYHYGFEATDDAFVREWLLAFPNGRQQMLFERRDGAFEFGRNLKGRNRIIAELTRANSLFLSAAAQNGHAELGDISRFFGDLEVIKDASAPRFQLMYSKEARGLDKRTMKFLSDIGTGVFDYELTKDEMRKEALEGFQKLYTIVEEMGGGPPKLLRQIDRDSYKLKLKHVGMAGEPVSFDLSQESDGTVRLLALLEPIHRALSAGTAVVIDELDSSLHTLACEAILGLFSISNSNPKGAQLIATTHDTNLLRSPLLRRDQIWFTEKDTGGATHLYPLTDFRTGKRDNIARGYLQGRYGAIPFAGPLPDVDAAD